MCLLSLPDPKVVVGLDFGTTFSGFAYADTCAPDEVYQFYEWPDANCGGGKPYCKTQTSLYYVPAAAGNGYELKAWGWTALADYNEACMSAAKANRQSRACLANDALSQRSSFALEHVAEGMVGQFITKFKLHLAGETNLESSEIEHVSVHPLPDGLIVERTITDYLSKLGEFVMTILRKNFGPTLTGDEVKWCLTVPAIWDDSAKQKMKICAERAGIVAGHYTPRNVVASPHPLQIVLEPEAASLFCWNLKRNMNLKMGDEFVVVDIGGGTVDIVVQAKASEGSELRVKEVQASSGGLCGGTYVDANFFSYIYKEIGCFNSYTQSENPSVRLYFQSWWQNIKYTFDGKRTTGTYDLNIPGGLIRRWELHDQEAGLQPRDAGYEVLEISTEAVRGFFAPVIDEIIHLIHESMTAHVKVLMVVGGFAESPYVMARIYEVFSDSVDSIVNPPRPGAAISHGAVLMGLSSQDEIVSRISRKTYGIATSRRFVSSNDPQEKRCVMDGKILCKDVFTHFVRRGDDLGVNDIKERQFFPAGSGATSLTVEIFSCRSDLYPQFVTDPGVVLEGSFMMDISEPDGLKLDRARSVSVTMHFGGSVIEVRGRRVNFGDTAAVQILPVAFYN